MIKKIIRQIFFQYVNRQSSENWIGDENENLSGFTWRGGNERTTTGIMIWPGIFFYDYPNGKKVAILFMDTQGTFDNQSTFRASVTIFALSQLLASVQIYNLSREIQENNLQYLKFFAEYGKLTQGATTGKPFQKLQFLIRDWPYPYETAYGAAGGAAVIKKIMSGGSDQSDENNELRQNIRDSFETIDCFLLPHPGKKVATDPNFQGKVKDIDEDFILHMKEFVPSILAPENLIIKKINGVELKAKDFVRYLTSYNRILSGSDLPTPKTILAATADAHNYAAVSTAKDYYSELMEKNINNDKFLSMTDLEAMHVENNKKAFEFYNNIPKVHGVDTTPFTDDLEKGNEKKFYYYVLINQKNHPDLSSEIKELFETITSQNDIIDRLTAQNTQSIMGLMAKLDSDRETHRKEISDMKESFAHSSDRGFTFIDKLLNFLQIIPNFLFGRRH